MNLRIKFLTFVCLCCALIKLTFAVEIKFKSYAQGDWNKLTTQSAGQPLIIHFWGVTCGPCLTEMPEWGKFVAQNKNFKVLFIQVDDISKEMMSRFISRVRLESADNYALVDSFDERIRYEVDPKWQGETPVTFLISKDSKKIREVGPVNFTELKKWYLKNM